MFIHLNEANNTFSRKQIINKLKVLGENPEEMKKVFVFRGIYTLIKTPAADISIFYVGCGIKCSTYYFSLN